MTTLQEKIAQRVKDAIERGRRGQAEPPPDTDTGVEFVEVSGTGAAVLRTLCVECTECHAIVLKGSTTGHGQWHVAMLLEMAGGTSSGGFIAPDPPS